MKNQQIETDFYFFAKMAGIEQKRLDKFEFDGKIYTAHAFCDDGVAKAMGGKARGFKLLRYAKLIEHIGATPNGAHIKGIVSASFDAVSQKYPILRSYYEATMVGGTHDAWIRWKD